MNLFKRGIASLLVLSMILSQLPVTVMADLIENASAPTQTEATALLPTDTESVLPQETPDAATPEEPVLKTDSEENAGDSAEEQNLSRSAQAEDTPVASEEAEEEAVPDVSEEADAVPDASEDTESEEVPVASEAPEEESVPSPSEEPEIGELEYTIDEDGILTISGEGGMGEAPWLEDGKTITTVILEEGVTSICAGAFAGCTELDHVFLPNSLRRIGASAFSGCTGLRDLFIPEYVTRIDVQAFSGCTGLKQIRLACYDLYILEDAFTGVNATVRYPYDSMYYGGNYGGSLNWTGFNPVLATGIYGTHRWIVDENGNTEISGFGQMEEAASAADYPWSNYAKRVIWMTVGGSENIPANAFAGFTNLQQVSFNMVDSIGSSAFSGCSSLATINFIGRTEKIAADAFAGVVATVCCEAEDGWKAADYLNYGGSLTWTTNENGTYGDNIVWSISGDELMIFAQTQDSLVMESQASAEGYPWYAHKDRIRNVYLGGVSAGDYLFDGYTNLETAAINSVPSVGAFAFKNCTSLTEVEFGGNKPKTIADTAFTGVTATAWYYDGYGWNADSLQDYGGDLTWKKWTYVEPEMDSGTHGDAQWTLSVSGHLTITGSGAMAPAAEDGSFGWDAYKNQINGVTVDGLTSIADGAFAGCSQLQTLNIGASVTTVGSGILKNTSVYQVEFSGDPPAIAEDAFEGLEYVTALYPYSRQEEWAGHDEQNYGGTEIYWSVMIHALDGGRVGDGLWTMQENGTLRIYPTNYSEGNAFPIPVMEKGTEPWAAYASQIIDISLEYVTELPEGVFSGLSALKWVYFQAETLTRIGSRAFADCPSLSDFSIPETVTEIGSQAFANCTGVNNFSFSGLVESIAEDAFLGVKAMAHYPLGVGWTEEMLKSYGGELTWESVNLLIENGNLEGTDICWDLYGDGLLCLYGNYEENGTEMPSLPSAEDYPWNEFAAKVTAISTSCISSIGDYAFAGCTELESFRFSLEIRKVGNYIFNGCSKLEHLIFDSDAPVIAENAFSGITARVSWPTANETWTGIAGENFGGNLDWGFAECEHANVTVLPGQAPGCTSEGLTEGSYCADCGTTLTSQQTIAPLGHDYTSVETKPSCTESGYITYSCTRCDSRYEETGEAALGHTEVTIPAVEAGCEENGLTEGSKCSVCGMILTEQNETPKLGHDYVSEETYPTCTESGYITHTCTRCGNSYEEAGEPPLDHDYEYEETAPSCTKYGDIIATCIRCGDSYTVPGHPPLGHDYVSEETGPTCTRPGYVIYTCTRCGDSDIEDTAAPLGHTEVVDEAVDPECEKPGWTAGSHCQVCDIILVAQKEIPALGHNYADGACTLCGADDPYSGTCGNGLHWVFETNTETLTISGNGAMDEFQAVEDRPWQAFARSIRALHVEDGVTTLGQYAFAGCSSLTEITLPAGLTKIGSYAFDNCSALTGTLLIPETVTQIGNQAFCNCTGLTGDLAVPDSVTSIGAAAFMNCTGFDGKLTLSENLTELGSDAFRNCCNITGTLTIPDQVTKINAYTFSGMQGITEIILGEKVSEIFTDTGAAHGFYDMEGVARFTFRGLTPPVLSDSGSDLFTYIAATCRIYVPAEAYRAYAQAYQGRRLYAVGVEGDFLTDGDTLVAYCGNGGDVQIPEGITTIGYAAFRKCHWVTSVTMPETVTAIEDNAFEGCVDLATVEFPAALKTIGKQAFDGCVNLSVVELSDEVTTIGEKCFYQCVNLHRLVLPRTLKYLEPYTFAGCESLESLELPGSLMQVANYTFQDCSSLTGTLVIPDSVVAIGNFAFEGCMGLRGLTLGNSVTRIGSYAFQDCYGLEGDLVIPDSVTKIGQFAFKNCSALQGRLVLSENLTDIGQWAFAGCGFTGELVIPDSVKSGLEPGAFTGTDGITALTIGSGITTICTSAYGSNHSLSMAAVQQVNFRSVVPPAATESTSIFAFMPNLKRICVPGTALDAYKAAYSGQIPEHVAIMANLSEMCVTELKASPVYSRTAVISWTAHVSEEVVEYQILVNGEPVGSTAECSFAVRDLTAGEAYTLGVLGRTADGKETATAEIQVTTVVPAATDLDAGNAYNKIGRQNLIRAVVTDSGNLESFEEKHTTVALYYLLDGQPILIGEALREDGAREGSVRYALQWDISDVEDGEYTLLCRVTDADGTVGEYTESFSVDKTVPKQLNDVAAVADITRIHVNWGLSWEADTTVYRIYKRAAGEKTFSLLAQIENRYILTYTDEAVEKDVAYEYYVVGVNSFGQEGEISPIVTAMLATDEQAPVVTEMIPQDKRYLSGTTTITMKAQDNLAATKTALYLSLDNGNSWTLLNESADASCSAQLDTSILADGMIQVKGVAWDAMANESAPKICTYCVDNTGPAQITGLAYESTHVTMTLRWEDVADQDVAFFRVEQKNSDGTYSTVQDVSATLGVNFSGLKPDTEYIYRVVGYDKWNNRGIPSADLHTTTLSDTMAPVVTALRPLPGYYADTVPFSVTASDEFAVSGLRIQISRDTIEWEDVHTVTFPEPAALQTVDWPLDLTAYEEGDLFVRAVVTDTAGNESDTGSQAPYVQYVVDRTAPGVPANVTAEGFDGYVELRWEQGVDADVVRYEVLRAENDETTYHCVAENVEALNWFDKNVRENITYSYQVAAYDAAGNRSDNSAVVSAGIIPDQEAPEIVSIYPNQDCIVGGEFREVSVLVRDNGMLESITMEYCPDGGLYRRLKKWEQIGQDNATVWTDLPLEEFRDGEAVNIRVAAEDASGNISTYSVTRYVVDNQAPAVTEAEAAFEKDVPCIRWTGGQEKDLAGYQIYRSIAGADDWQLVNRFVPDAGTGADCFCYDYSLPLGAGTYYYKVEALDEVGNSAFSVTREITVTAAGTPDTGETPAAQAPKAELYFDPIQEAGKEYFADASASTDDVVIETYLIDFGDGTTSRDRKTTHIYAQPGTYDATLWVTDNEGNTSFVCMPVEVREPSTVGTLQVVVKDQHGAMVPGASVYFDLGGENQIKKRTDSLGTVEFTAAAGRHVIGALIADNQWLPAKTTVIITAGETISVELTMVKEPLVEGTFEVERMTHDEIVAAGIDPSLPDNQHILKITVKLQYAGKELEAEVAFNRKTGKSKGNPLRVLATDGIPRDIIPVIIPVGGGGGSGGGGGNGDGETPVIPFPDWAKGEEEKELSDLTVAYLDVPVEASFLKEFFDVRLHIMNNSSVVSMLDNLVTLNIPEGISLVEGEGAQKYNVVSIPKIAANSAETLAWILRGDTAGSYDLSADYSGRVSEFNENIRARFETQEPLVVNGLDAVKLIAEFNTKLYYDGFYFNLGIENIGDTDIYLPSIGVTENTISTYAKKVGAEKGLEPWETINFRDKNVSHYNTILCSNTGFSQQIGKNAEITRLAPGEMLLRQFVVYNATGLNNRLHLVEAVQETAQSTGVNIEIRKSDMDLFSMDDPVEKFDKIFKGGNVAGCYDMYKKVTDPFNYLYVMQSVDSNTKWSFDVVLEGFYKAGKILWEFDMDYNEDDTRKIVRKIVCQLLQDESMQQAIRENEEAKYLKIAAEMFAFISSTLGQMDVMDENYVEQWKDFNESGDNIQKLAQYMMGAGEEGAYDRFCAFMMSHCTNVSLRSVIIMICDSSEATSAWMDAVSKACKPAKELMSLGSGIYNAWTDSLELTRQLIQIAAAKEEAEAVLDILIKHTEEESCIYKELNEIKNSLKKANDKLWDEFIKRAGNVVLTQTRKQIAKVLMENMDLIWKGNAAASGGAAASGAAAGAGTASLSVCMRVASVYAAMGMVFSASDYLFGFEKTVEDLHIFRVCTALAFALRDEVTINSGTQDEEEARSSLRALKYLIKMHLLGEEYFTTIYKDDDSKRSWSYNMLNGGLHGDYDPNRPHVPFTGMEDYYARISKELLTFRDSIFGAYYTDISIPAAPEVTLDYVNCTTVEEFTGLYEYSYDGSTWKDCDGGTIRFVPGVLAGSLWIRVKGTGANPAGNIAKVVIPGRPLIQGNVIVLDTGDQYVVSGLAAGTYCYQFVDEQSADQLVNTFYVGSGQTVTLTDSRDWTYLALQTAPQEQAFASAIRYVVTEDLPAAASTEAMIRQSILDGAKEIRVEGEVTLKKSLTIPEGVTLVITETGSLTVPARLSLINHGAIQVFGTLTIGGKFAGNLIMAEAGAQIAAAESDYLQKGQLSETVNISGEKMCAAGRSIQLTAEVLPLNAWDKSLMWSIVSGGEHARIEPSTGKLTGVSAGEVTVQARTLDGSNLAAEYNIEITNYRVAIEADALSLTANSKMTLRASLLPTNYSNTGIVWTLEGDGSQYATLTVNKANSTATLTAKDVTEKQTVTVTASAADGRAADGQIVIDLHPITEKVRITKADRTDVTGTKILFDLNRIDRGVAQRTMQLYAVSLPEGSGNGMVWKSSNTKLATVDESGFVVFTGNTGTAKITATAADGSKAAAVVTIEAVKLVQNVVLADNTPTELDAGRILSLAAFEADAEGNPIGKKLPGNKILWSLAPEDEPYATITANGRLTARNVVEKVTVTATASVIGNENRASISHQITIRPLATQVELFRTPASRTAEPEEPVNGSTIRMTGETLVLRADTYPADAQNAVAWSVASLSRYADYQVDEQTNSLIISNASGKSGTVTVKAVVQDSSKKAAQVKVVFGIFVDTVTVNVAGSTELLDGYELTGGEAVQLRASAERKQDDRKPGNTAVVWSLENPADQKYVTLTSGGKVTAKQIAEKEVRVAVLATAKDGGGAYGRFVLTLKPADPQMLVLKQLVQTDTGTGLEPVANAEVCMEVGEQICLSACDLDGMEHDAIWTSGKNSVATADNGTIIARAVGTANVTAQYGEKSVSVKVKVVKALADSVEILGEDLSVASGKALTLRAQIQGSGSQRVSWSVLTGSKYAKISSTGRLTAVKDLTSSKEVVVRATATDGSGKFAQTTVVIKPVAQGVQICTGQNLVESNTVMEWDMENSSTLTLSALVYPFYGTNDARNALQKVKWTSSSRAIATVDDNGVVTCLKPGKTTITATADDGSSKKISFTLTVVNRVKDLRMEPQVLAGGRKLNLAKLLTIFPENSSTKKFTWQISGGDGAAYVSLNASGLLSSSKVTEHKQVRILVTAQDSAQYHEEFVVDIYPATTRVSIQTPAQSIPVGESLQLVGDSSPTGAANRFVWKSSSQSIAAVDENGLVTAVKPGTVTITCTTADGSGKKATVRIRVT